jgi:hypothetical protein
MYNDRLQNASNLQSNKSNSYAFGKESIPVYGQVVASKYVPNASSYTSQYQPQTAEDKGHIIQKVEALFPYLS